jgi:hypothetical protein
MLDLQTRWRDGRHTGRLFGFSHTLEHRAGRADPP